MPQDIITEFALTAQNASDTTIEMLTTNAASLVECMTDLIIATDRALITVSNKNVQELNCKFQGKLFAHYSLLKQIHS